MKSFGKLLYSTPTLYVVWQSHTLSRYAYTSNLLGYSIVILYYKLGKKIFRFGMPAFSTVCEHVTILWILLVDSLLTYLCFLLHHCSCRSVGSPANHWSETSSHGLAHVHQDWPRQSSCVWWIQRECWTQWHIGARPGEMGMEVYMCVCDASTFWCVCFQRLSQKWGR